MREFKSTSALLRVMNEITPYKRGISQNMSWKPPPSVVIPKVVECFNCGESGHRAIGCSKPRRQKDACYSCGKLGHSLRDCPLKASTESSQKALTDYSPKASTSRETDSTTNRTHYINHIPR
ncbi:uncharacterized protein LOC113369773 [Ctenocephalides felis]|nr:uncharacterized protein LOC113369773 [Ctenocephalides felis]